MLARLGYACKGVVYLIIGGLAVKLAIGQGGAATDQKGALQTIYEQPFGKFLLVVVGIGLCLRFVDDRLRFVELHPGHFRYGR